MIIAFTGHRPDALGGYDNEELFQELKERIKIVLYKLKPEMCISGMAIGVDQIAAKACLELKIPFEAAIPFKGQEKMWPFESKKEYQKILNQAVKKTIVCEGGYSPWKMLKRNEYMVDKCDLLFSVWNGKESGGTWRAIEYAKKLNKKILNLNPKNMKFEKINKGE